MRIELNWKVIVGAVLLLAVGGYFGYQYILKLRNDRANAELAASTTQRVNDSTTARLAITTIQRDSLAVLLSLAKELGGKPIAGATITFPVRDTAVVHDTLPTVAEDSWRTAHINDSLFAGTLVGTVVAPPYPAPLRFNYRFTRTLPPITVAFVQVGEKYYAVARQGTDSVQIEAPYVKPLPSRLKPIGWFVSASINPFDLKATGSGGFRISLDKSLDIKAGVDARIGPFVGAEKRF